MIKQTVLGQRWVDIRSDWFGLPSENHARFCIDQESGQLIFSAEADGEPYLHPDFSGGYCEGLWEYDVAEWFVYNPETELYLECNLSPQGAWWMQVFVAPRRRMEKQNYDLAGVSARGELTAHGWSASLSIPVSLLKTVLGEGEWRHNVCFILGKESRQYFSWTRLNAAKPDFHRPAEFLQRV